MPKKVTAHFTPQAWVSDNAIEVDPAGPQEWDATEFYNDLDAHYRRQMDENLRSDDEVLDYDDLFKHDPAAPEWVRLHRGPFDIHLRWEETSGP